MVSTGAKQEGQKRLSTCFEETITAKRVCVGCSVYGSRVAIHFHVHVHIHVHLYVHVHFCVHVTLLRMRAHRIVATLTRHVQALKQRPQIPTVCVIALAIEVTFSGGLTLDLVLRNCHGTSGP